MPDLRNHLDPPGDLETRRIDSTSAADIGLALLTMFGLVGTAGVTWFVVTLGGICIDGIQTNCNSSWRPLAAAVAVSGGAVVALFLIFCRSRLAPKALVAAFAWSVLTVGVMDAIYLAESRSLASAGFLLPWNLIMLAPAFLYLLGAYEQKEALDRRSA